jgi:hypothetical protein
MRGWLMGRSLSWNRASVKFKAVFPELCVDTVDTTEEVAS